MTPALDDLLIQPRLGRLTLVSTPLTIPGHRRCCVVTVCYCGRFVLVPRWQWVSGPRPEQCQTCWRERSQRELTGVTQRAPVLPYRRAGRR